MTDNFSQRHLEAIAKLTEEHLHTLREVEVLRDALAKANARGPENPTILPSDPSTLRLVREQALMYQLLGGTDQMTAPLSRMRSHLTRPRARFEYDEPPRDEPPTAPEDSSDDDSLPNLGDQHPAASGDVADGLCCGSLHTGWYRVDGEAMWVSNKGARVVQCEGRPTRCPSRGGEVAQGIADDALPPVLGSHAARGRAPAECARSHSLVSDSVLAGSISSQTLGTGHNPAAAAFPRFVVHGRVDSADITDLGIGAAGAVDRWSSHTSTMPNAIADHNAAIDGLTVDSHSVERGQSIDQPSRSGTQSVNAGTRARGDAGMRVEVTGAPEAGEEMVAMLAKARTEQWVAADTATCGDGPYASPHAGAPTPVLAVPTDRKQYISLSEGHGSSLHVGEAGEGTSDTGVTADTGTLERRLRESEDLRFNLEAENIRLEGLLLSIRKELEVHILDRRRRDSGMWTPKLRPPFVAPPLPPYVPPHVAPPAAPPPLPPPEIITWSPRDLDESLSSTDTIPLPPPTGLLRMEHDGLAPQRLAPAAAQATRDDMLVTPSVDSVDVEVIIQGLKDSDAAPAPKPSRLKLPPGRSLGVSLEYVEGLSDVGSSSVGTPRSQASWTSVPKRSLLERRAALNRAMQNQGVVDGDHEETIEAVREVRDRLAVLETKLRDPSVVTLLSSASLHTEPPADARAFGNFSGLDNSGSTVLVADGSTDTLPLPGDESQETQLLRERLTRATAENVALRAALQEAAGARAPSDIAL